MIFLVFFFKDPDIMETTVLLPRDQEGNEALAGFLKANGLDTLSWPTLRYDRFLLKVRDFSHFDWLVFTSPHAAQFFCEQTQKLPEKISFAAIGQRTAKVLEDFGYK